MPASNSKNFWKSPQQDNVQAVSFTDDTDRTILYETRKLVINQGVSATTMAAIARAAGISRPTLYARYPNRDAVIRQILNHEIVGLLDAAFPIPDTVEEFIQRIVTVADKAVHNELLISLIDHEPEALVTYQYKRLGRSQKTLIRFVRNIIAKLQASEPAPGQPAIRNDDPQVLATFIVSTTQATALQAKALSPMLPHPEMWKQELSRILEGYLYQCP